jgi:hypothetical protein
MCLLIKIYRRCLLYFNYKYLVLLLVPEACARVTVFSCWHACYNWGLQSSAVGTRATIELSTYCCLNYFLHYEHFTVGQQTLSLICNCTLHLNDNVYKFLCFLIWFIFYISSFFSTFYLKLSYSLLFLRENCPRKDSLFFHTVWQILSFIS